MPDEKPQNLQKGISSFTARMSGAGQRWADATSDSDEVETSGVMVEHSATASVEGCKLHANAQDMNRGKDPPSFETSISSQDLQK